MREYAEEFLDVEEAYGRGGRTIDYVNQSPFKELNDARRSGRLEVYVLGIGLDPLDWKPGIFTICIFDQTPSMVSWPRWSRREKKEPSSWAHVEKGSHSTPSPSGCTRTTRTPSTLQRVCLKLAWQHRGALGLDCS
jgi:hypothetical protein